MACTVFQSDCTVFRGRYCYCFEEDNCCLNLYEAKGVHACSTPCVRLRGIGFCCTTFAVVKHCARNIFFENASFGHFTTVVAMLCVENILESVQASFLLSSSVPHALPFPPLCSSKSLHPGFVVETLSLPLSSCLLLLPPHPFTSFSLLLPSPPFHSPEKSSHPGFGARRRENLIAPPARYFTACREI